MTGLILALAVAAVSDFQAAFPAASVVASPAGGRLVSATGFEAAGLGETPEAAARAFLEKHGATFGIGARHDLRLKSAPPAGKAGPVRFERRIGGWPIFGGDVVVGVDARGAVNLVNTGDVPAETTGRWHTTREAAVAAAAEGLAGKPAGTPRSARGWRALGGTLRPVWRVDQATSDPAGEWRVDVDAGTGKVLFRTDLRHTGAPPPGR